MLSVFRLHFYKQSLQQRKTPFSGIFLIQFLIQFRAPWQHAGTLKVQTRPTSALKWVAGLPETSYILPRSKNGISPKYIKFGKCDENKGSARLYTSKHL